MEVALSNGIKIELVSRGREFLGLGRISAGTVRLRSGRRPMFVEIRNPWAVQLADYRIAKKKIGPGGAVIEFTASRRVTGPMEWMLHTVRPLYNTADWSQPPKPAQGTRLILEIKPVSRTLNDVSYEGFSYQYRYRSPDIPIFKILDRGTWEIDGRAVGNELWTRCGFLPPIHRFKSDAEHYSLEWYLGSIEQPNILQFLPFQTCMQGFTFTAAEAGILVTWATEVAHIRTLLEKPRGTREIVHWHEHCGDLAQEFATSPVEVLWSPGKRDWTGRANAYNDILDLVYDTLHAQVGMRRERIRPYGVIEEWEDADLDYYRREGLPKLLKAGAKLIYLANHFRNNMNTYGVHNFCCNVDYQVAETVGEDNLKRFCDDAKAGGAQVEMWGNTALSNLTLILNHRQGRPKRIDFLPKEGSAAEKLKSKRPFVHNPSGAIESDHYSLNFLTLNLRDPDVRAYWMKCWKYAHDQIGLEGLFLDSSFNMTSDKFDFHYNPRPGESGAKADPADLLDGQRPAREPPAAIRSQFRAHLELMVEMQKAGYLYDAEDVGVFGLHRCGPEIMSRINTLPLWPEHFCSFDIPALRQAGMNPDDAFFRGLAYRMMWFIFWIIKSNELSFCYHAIRGDFDRPTEWHFALLRAFDKVNEWMVKRRILPDEAGIVYRSGDKRVLWAFRDLEYPLAGEQSIQDVLDKTTLRAQAIKAKKNHIYVAG